MSRSLTPVAWPASIAQIGLSSTFVEASDVNVAKYLPEGEGEPFYRCRSVIMSDRVKFTLLVTSDELDTFNDFYADDLIDGIKPFSFTDPRTQATVVYIFMAEPTISAVTGALFNLEVDLQRIPA
jgi:hypothetical protein